MTRVGFDMRLNAKRRRLAAYRPARRSRVHRAHAPIASRPKNAERTSLRSATQATDSTLRGCSAKSAATAALPGGARGAPQQEKDEEHVGAVEEKAREVVPRRRHPEEADVRHVGHPRERMPVRGLGRGDRPGGVAGGQSGADVRVADDVLLVVVADEAVAEHGAKTANVATTRSAPARAVPGNGFDDGADPRAEGLAAAVRGRERRLFWRFERTQPESNVWSLGLVREEVEELSERRDSNPQGFPHGILSPARLPVPPLRNTPCNDGGGQRLSSVVLAGTGGDVPLGAFGLAVQHGPRLRGPRGKRRLRGAGTHPANPTGLPRVPGRNFTFSSRR